METSKQWIKRNWKAILIIILVAVAVWFLKPTPITPVQDNAVITHQFDSVKYIKTADSMKVVIGSLEAEIVKRSRAYAYEMTKIKSKISSVQTLPANQVTEVFSDRIYHDVTIREDSNVIVPMQGIRNAVVLFYERDAALSGVDFYYGQDSLKSVVIDKQKELIGIKDNRIVTLTGEFYTSQATIEGLRKDVEKQQRKVRNRNRMLGIVAGAGAIAILVAVAR